MKHPARFAVVVILGLTAALTAACGGTPNTTTTNPPTPSKAVVTPPPTDTGSPVASTGCTPGSFQLCADFTHGMDDEHGTWVLLLAGSAPVTEPWTAGTPTVFQVSGGSIAMKGASGSWEIQFQGVDTSNLKFDAVDESGGTAKFNVLPGGSVDVTTTQNGVNSMDSFRITGQQG